MTIGLTLSSSERSASQKVVQRYVWMTSYGTEERERQPGRPSGCLRQKTSNKVKSRLKWAAFGRDRSTKVKIFVKYKPWPRSSIKSLRFCHIYPTSNLKPHPTPLNTRTNDGPPYYTEKEFEVKTPHFLAEQNHDQMTLHLSSKQPLIHQFFPGKVLETEGPRILKKKPTPKKR